MTFPISELFEIAFMVMVGKVTIFLSKCFALGSRNRIPFMVIKENIKATARGYSMVEMVAKKFWRLKIFDYFLKKYSKNIFSKNNGVCAITGFYKKL